MSMSVDGGSSSFAPITPSESSGADLQGPQGGAGADAATAPAPATSPGYSGESTFEDASGKAADLNGPRSNATVDWSHEEEHETHPDGGTKDKTKTTFHLELPELQQILDTVGGWGKSIADWIGGLFGGGKK